MALTGSVSVHVGLVPSMITYVGCCDLRPYVQSSSSWATTNIVDRGRSWRDNTASVDSKYLQAFSRNTGLPIPSYSRPTSQTPGALCSDGAKSSSNLGVRDQPSGAGALWSCGRPRPTHMHLAIGRNEVSNPR